jgi:hypothetical protein
MRKQQVEGHGTGRIHAPRGSSPSARLNHFEGNGFEGIAWAGPRLVGGMTDWRRARSRTFCSSYRYPRVSGAGALSPAPAASAR